MKKLFVALLTILLFIPAVVFAEGKVKVYIFEAGGCPYCEMEVEYLKGLSSYNKKFEIVRKELYVDHVDWKQGKDYKLGVKVATAFNDAGFEDAAYTGTPFVVISDLYAVAGYSEDLEDIILEAYEEGDKDAVSCIKAGKGDCVRPINTEELPDKAEKTNSKGGVVIAILAGVALIGVIVYVFKNRSTTIVEEKEIIEEAPKKAAVKKTAPKKTTTKKTPTKKATTKKTKK